MTTALRILALAWALLFLCVPPARAACSLESTAALTSAATHWDLDVTVLTALALAESSCNPRAANRRSHSIGLLQIKLNGSANPWGFTRDELKNPWLNADLGARHLARCLAACGTIGKAIGLYHGGRCREDGFARRVLRLARAQRLEPTS